jgi:hypothetical protein
MSRERIAGLHADWLVDAIATATQDRRYLRGHPKHDPVATEAIRMNGKRAILLAFQHSDEDSRLAAERREPS